MRRLISMLLVLTLCLSLAACGAVTETKDTENDTAPSQSLSDITTSGSEETTQATESVGNDGVCFTKLSSGSSHVLALDTDGRIWGWGGNQHSCLGDFAVLTEEPALFCEAAAFTDIKASVYFSAALDTNGGLWTWGWNTCGQLGDGSTTDRGEPAKVLENVSSFAVGYDYVVAIAEGGTLYTWGNGSNHMLLKQDTNDTACVLTPTPVVTELTFAYVSGGESGCIAYDTDGIRYAWGLSNAVAGYDGTQYGYASGETFVPYVLKPITVDTVGYSEFVIYNNTVFAINDGNLYLAGGKDSRLSSFENNPSFCQFTLVKEGIKAVSPSTYGVLAIDTEGNVWGWGGSAFPPCTNGDLTQLTEGITFSDAVVLDYIEPEVFAIDESGTLYTWLAEGDTPQVISVQG